jgi:hypothetical protein
MVPEDQIGTTLYPLNQLRDVQPELYKTKASKYDGREHIMERQIPILHVYGMTFYIYHLYHHKN